MPGAGGKFAKSFCIASLMVSALSRRIRHVRAEEFSDIRSYRAEAVVRDVMLFGKPPELAAKSPMLRILGAGFQQSIDMLAAGLGFALDAEKRTRHEMALATAQIETPVGVIAPGTVAAQRFTWEGTVRGEPVVSVRVNWLMGEERLAPAWSFGGPERFELEITGEPSVQVSFHGLHPPDVHDAAALERNPGITATAMHCVNAIPYVCRAQPGIRSYLDLPLVVNALAADAGWAAAQANATPPPGAFPAGDKWQTWITMVAIARDSATLAPLVESGRWHWSAKPGPVWTDDWTPVAAVLRLSRENLLGR